MKNAIHLVLSLISLSIGSSLHAQNMNDTASALLQELDNSYAQLLQLASALAENTQAQETLRSEADRLNDENAQLDQQLASYHSALDMLNSGIADYTQNCAGQALSNEALSACEDQRIDLENRNTTLTAQFDQLNAREARYSANVEDLNQRENERALAAQQIVRSYQQAEMSFDDLVARLVQLNMDSQACVALEPDDTYPCMQEFWREAN